MHASEVLVLVASVLLVQGCGASLGASCNVDSDCRRGLSCNANAEGNGNCHDEGSQATAEEATAEEPAAALSLDPSDIPLEARCEVDEDCVATQFHDCCADNAGQCMCDWHALNREWAEQALLECGVEECTDGTCHACPPTEPVRHAHCAANLYCSLTPN